MNHKTTISVRGYELDSYGHVNNAVYLQYLEQARWEFMRELKILNYLRKNKYLLVVTESHVRYVREATLFEELEVISSLKTDPPYLVFDQKIRKKTGQLLVTKARIKTIFLNEKKVPVDIPSIILQEK